MSAATAIYTLGEEEALHCGACGILCHAGTDMEITADPDGITVSIRCENCPTEEDL